MKDKVRQVIKEHKMLSPGDSVLVGLSGGADSVALLCCLLSLRDELGITVKACHINHRLRGEQSDLDEQFVRRLCERKGVELFCRSFDVAQLASERKIGLEQCGRQLRYEAFAELSGITATAHTASDNIETVILNLARGASLDGMRGILPKNQMGKTLVIRPLITCSRGEIEQYLDDLGESYVTDESNFDTSYTRNLVRHKIVPVLRQMNPSLESAVTRMSKALGTDADYFAEKTAKLLEAAFISENCYNAEILAAAPEPVSSRAFAKILRRCGLEQSSEKIAYLADTVKNGTKYSVGGGWFSKKLDGRLVMSKARDKISFEIPFSEGIHTLETGKTVEIREISAEKLDLNKRNILYYTLDCDKINVQTVIRNRRDGDRIRLHGRNFTSRLKKLFCESVPEEQRDRVVIIADSEGPVFVEGFGASQRAQVTKDTKRAYVIKIK